MKKSELQYLIGVDEVGRGPIAGPVAVGVVLIPIQFCSQMQRKFAYVRDSKQHTPKQREEIYEEILEEKRLGRLDFSVGMSGSELIDKKGIVFAIKQAMKRALSRVQEENGDEEYSRVLLDGGLHAPKTYPDQETIIKGDESETIISLASIVAKVTRDKKMIRYGEKYPEYLFEQHKGYGTREHYKRIQAYKFSPIHRKTFLKEVDIS